ncbi:hypothetical protein Q4603_15495 [Zobellia galactanivorans]|uniref:hypothetical protein n=1 Tax=Zobellia galactanivorans (strain DSM 12802 / CCUG 47099 / CIP 106680 / NCIMB 13871 / Dsij) TaxID=63186 RepID=UPI0026E2E26C|nr:hypothetical protein [Zobellia galactanivorans]MDO6810028.1 hypothetical protein [Zobellia galactanivorans]
MNQKHLVVYLEYHNCIVLKEPNKTKGFFLMQNPDTGKMNGVPYPSNGENLKESTICMVCQNLGVPSPPSTSPEFDEMMSKIQEEANKEINGNKK